MTTRNLTAPTDDPRANGLPPDRRPPSPVLYAVRVALLGAVALGFPVATFLVFGRDADRTTVATGVAYVYSVGLFLAFTTAWWPLPSLRLWDVEARLRSTVVLFTGVSYFTHLSWELVWLLAHRVIRHSRDAAWAYPWWAYIDGGDYRYAEAPANLISMEILSVTNGVIGIVALVCYLRSERRGAVSVGAVLAMMATAVVHLYSTSLYFLSEIVAGLPNVNTDSFSDTFIKFGLANAPWLVFPPLVLWWGFRIAQTRKL